MTLERHIKITVDGSEASKSIDDINTKSAAAKGSIDKFTKALQSLLKNTSDSFRSASIKIHSFNESLKSSAAAQFNSVLDKMSSSLIKMKSAISSVIAKFKTWGRDIRKHPIKHLRAIIGKINTGLHFMAARFAALAGGMSSIIKANNLFTNFHATMSVVVEDSKKVDQEWNFVNKTANKLGVSLLGVVEPYARLKAALQAIEPSGQAARVMFEGIATAAVVLHKPVADTNLMFLAMEQVASKGKLSLEELQKQFAQKVPGAMLIAARAANYSAQTMGQFFSAIRKGNIDVGHFMKAFGQGLIDTFNPGLKIASNSFQAISNRLSNVFTSLRIELSQSGFIQGINGILSSIITKLGTTGVTAAVKRLSAEFGNLFNVAADWIDSITSQNISDIIDIITASVKSLKDVIKKIFDKTKGSDLVSTFRTVAKTIVGIAETIYKIVAAAANMAGISSAQAAEPKPGDVVTTGGFSIMDTLTTAGSVLLDSAAAWGGLIYKVFTTKVGSTTTVVPTPYDIPNADGTQSHISSVVDSNTKLEKAIKDLNSDISIKNFGTSQFLTKMATYSNKATTFADRTSRSGQSAEQVANVRAITAARGPTRDLATINAELARVDKLVKDNDIILNSHNLGLRNSLLAAKAGLMSTLETIRNASAEELQTIKVKEAKKAEVVRNSFDKLLAHSGNQYALELKATRKSLQSKYDANVKYAADEIAFTKSFNAAQLRALSKYVKDSSTISSRKFNSGLRKSKTPQDAMAAMTSSNSQLDAAQASAISSLPDVTGREDAKQAIIDSYAALRLSRQADFNAKMADMNKVAADAELQLIQDRGQAGLDLKQEFSNAVSDGQQANLGNMAGAFDSFSKSIWDRDEKTGKFTVKNEASTWQGKLSIAGSAMKAMSGLMDSGNKKLFLLGKAAAVGSATVDTFTAVNKALASAPPPFNFALAAIVGAAGIANVVKIASTPFGGKGASASVPSGSGSSASSSRYANQPSAFNSNTPQQPTTPSIQITQHITAPNAQVGTAQAIQTAANLGAQQALAAVGQDFANNGALRQTLAV